MLTNMLTKHTLQLTAAMLGRKHKIAVEFQPQETACTNGRTIILPLLPAPKDPKSAHEILSLMRGYIDHEASHLRWTAFDIFSNEKDHDLFTMTNILEDIRVEKMLSKTYPGCKVNLSDLVKILKRKKQLGFTEKTLLCALMGYVSYRLRSVYLGQDVSDLARKGEKSLSSFLTADAITKLDGIMDQIRAAESTKDSARIATEILKTFNKSKKSKQDDEQSDSSEDDQDGKGNDSSGPGQGNSSESDSSESDSSESEKDGDSKGNDTGENDGDESEKDGASGSSETGQDNSNSSCSNQDGSKKDSKPNRKDQLKDLPSGLMTIGDALRKALEKSAAQAKNKSDDIRVNPTAGSSPASSSELTTRIDMAEAKQLANNIRLQTIAYLEARSFAKKSLSPIGRKINGRKLFKVSTPDPRIFQKTAQTKEINTDIYLILDRSGSMSSIKIIQADTTALALALAYKTIKGIKLTVIAFPGEERNTIIPIAINGEVIPERFRIMACGGTPMTTPLHWVLQQILENPNAHKKVVVVVTDGEPDDPAGSHKAVEELTKVDDTTVFMVGIPECNIPVLSQMVGEGKYIMVKDIKTLPVQLANLFRKNLTN